MEEAGGLVDGGWGGLRCLPAVQCGQGPWSERLGVTSAEVREQQGCFPVPYEKNILKMSTFEKSSGLELGSDPEDF